MKLLQVSTIGVYGKTEEQFFNTLLDNKIDIFIDVRRRRAVRGSKFSFVNSTKLQSKLKDIGIAYRHVLELAPTNEIRQLQKNEDLLKGALKRTRDGLGETFINNYQAKILDSFDLNSFIEELERSDISNPVFFCVEEKAGACHRSLITRKINIDLNIPINHL